jgi:hypothetical protein
MEPDTNMMAPTTTAPRPDNNPLRSDVTPLFRYLNQFGIDPAKICGGLQAQQRQAVEDLADPRRPFLTVITRTQGKRIGTLRDVLLGLSAQTCQDFELVLIPHKVTPGCLAAITEVVEEMTESFRAKVRILPCDHGGRTAPLNMGFSVAHGAYVSILDDDDVVFAHWVEEFKRCAERAPGRVIRVVAAHQEAESDVWDGGVAGFRSVTLATKGFPSEYDFFLHLLQNFSPPVALAFPRFPFETLGIRFDEALNTAEDWDFEMRTAFVCGVEASPEITCIYRKWRNAESSFTVHSQEEWKRDYARITEKFDSQYHIFPPGTVKLLQGHPALVQRLHQEVATNSKANVRETKLRAFLRRYPRLRGYLARGWRLSKKIKNRLMASDA